MGKKPTSSKSNQKVTETRVELNTYNIVYNNYDRSPVSTFT